MLKIWSAFTPRQRRNLFIYAFGIMCYKFGLEYYNGAFITMANERFTTNRYQKIGILTGLNYAMQCVGSIIVAPLIKKFPTRSVLSFAVFIFGLISAILLIVDAATGGIIRYKTSDNKTHYGSWNPNALFPIYVVSGISYGTVELIRRVIPRDIVGGDVVRLKKMDAIVHVLYEIAGTTGAFTSVALIGKFGYNYSFFLSPVLFCAAAIIWRFVDDSGIENRKDDLEEFENAGQGKSYFKSVLSGFAAFGKATYYGAFLVFSHRKFVWLVSGYSFALYGHRYLENGLGPIYARQVLGVSAWSQIMVGGSNFGELLGALSVLFLAEKIATPLPWLRLDALTLNLVWVLPYISFTRGDVRSAWKIAGIFIPVSYGWAAGDVSLAAYIQGTLAKMESKDSQVSALGAVMAFLYVTYIVLYAVISTVLGRWADRQLRGATGLVAAERAQNLLQYNGGVQFTVLCVVIIASTFIPRGSFAFNPTEFNEIKNIVPTEHDAEISAEDELKKDGVKRSNSDEYAEK